MAALTSFCHRFSFLLFKEVTVHPSLNLNRHVSTWLSKQNHILTYIRNLNVRIPSNPANVQLSSDVLLRDCVMNEHTDMHFSWNKAKQSSYLLWLWRGHCWPPCSLSPLWRVSAQTEMRAELIHSDCNYAVKPAATVTHSRGKCNRPNTGHSPVTEAGLTCSSFTGCHTRCLLH